MTGPTPSQTVGPFFAPTLAWPDGEGPVLLVGRVVDGAGDPVPDAMLEFSAPDVFRRVCTGPDGSYACHLPAFGSLDVSVFARGLLQRLVTRVYAPDGPEDDVLALVDPARRSTLRATADGDALRFDVRLRGEGETVFLIW